MDATGIEELKRDVEEYAQKHNGKIYAPIDHPTFAHVPSQHGAERFEPIRQHMPQGMMTALDIGTHWGYFAHQLEKLGLEVTAAENSDEYLSFLRRIREIYGDEFAIYSNSIFDLQGEVNFDVVLALNIFHHFTKTEKLHHRFVNFLERLNCQALFFQSHNVREGQMSQAFRNYPPEKFCSVIVAHVPTLNRFEEIATFGARPMFLLRA